MDLYVNNMIPMPNNEKRPINKIKKRKWNKRNMARVAWFIHGREDQFLSIWTLIRRVTNWAWNSPLTITSNSSHMTLFVLCTILSHHSIMLLPNVIDQKGEKFQLLFYQNMALEQMEIPQIRKPFDRHSINVSL